MILGILQARVSSSRLPGKVMKPILAMPMIWHQWERLQRVKKIDALVLATSTDASDDVLAHYFQARKQSVYRGSLQDVLDRFYQCALCYQPEHIVRLTGDCPLTDPSLIDALIDQHLQEKNDYTGISERTFPDGLDAEIFRYNALTQAHQEALMQSQREHVTLFIHQQPTRFKVGCLKGDEDLSHWRWTVDHPEDFEFVKQVYERLYPKNPAFDRQAIVNLIKCSPDLGAINAHIARNEGLARSLQHDAIFQREHHAEPL